MRGGRRRCRRRPRAGGRPRSGRAARPSPRRPRPAETTGSRPARTPDRSTRRFRSPRERGTRRTGVVAVGHQLGGHALEAVQRVRDHATGPHHVRGDGRGVEQGLALAHGAPARGGDGGRSGGHEVLDDRCLEPVEQVGHRLVLGGDATDGHRAGDDDHLVGAVRRVVGLPQRVRAPPAADVGVDHGHEVHRLAGTAAHLGEEEHVGGVQQAGRGLGVRRDQLRRRPRRARRRRRGRRRSARSGRRSRGARGPARGRASPRSARRRSSREPAAPSSAGPESSR